MMKSLRGKVVMMMESTKGELGDPNACSKKRVLERTKKYQKMEHGKAKTQSYLESDDFKETRKDYRESDSGMASVAKWANSDKAKEGQRRRREKKYGKSRHMPFELKCSHIHILLHISHQTP